MFSNLCGIEIKSSDEINTSFKEKIFGLISLCKAVINGKSDKF